MTSKKKSGYLLMLTYSVLSKFCDSLNYNASQN